MGNIRDIQGFCGANITKRIAAARERFYAMSGFWRAKVNTREKILEFKCQVFNTVLSGLEAECLTWNEELRIDQFIVSFARRACGSHSSYEGVDAITGAPKRFTKSSPAIRKLMNLSNAQAEMRHR